MITRYYGTFMKKDIAKIKVWGLNSFDWIIRDGFVVHWERGDRPHNSNSWRHVLNAIFQSSFLRQINAFGCSSRKDHQKVAITFCRNSSINFPWFFCGYLVVFILNVIPMLSCVRASASPFRSHISTLWGCLIKVVLLSKKKILTMQICSPGYRIFESS